MGGHLLGDVATEEVRRRERLVAVDDEAPADLPLGVALAVRAPGDPAPPGARFEDDGGRHGDDRDRAARARGRASARPRS